MNIAIWIYRLGNGGAERVITQLASEFEKEGAQITLLVHTNDNPYQDLVNNNINIVNLGHSLPSFLKPKTFFCLPGLVRFLKKQKPDIIFTTGAQHSIILIILSLIFKFSGKTIIRETNTLSAQKNFLPNFFMNALFRLSTLLYPAADHIIAPSQGVADDLIRHVKNIEHKISVIPNPIDFSEIQEKSSYPLSDTRLDQIPFILAVGRLVPQKGYDNLINAWAPIYQDKGTILVILGDGPERSKLLALSEDLGVSEGLLLPGFQKNPFQYMARCQVFVLSSYYEGLPNTLLQALACGPPVVATDCPSGPREILENGKWGTLVPVGDIEAITNALEHIATPNTQKTSIRNEMKKRYDINMIARTYLSLFEAVQGLSGKAQ